MFGHWGLFSVQEVGLDSLLSGYLQTDSLLKRVKLGWRIVSWISASLIWWVFKTVS